MARLRSMCGAAVLLLALAVSAGCGDDDNGVPTGPTVVSQGVYGPSVTAEPLVLTPEFLTGPFCFRGRPFAVRLSLLLAARETLALRSVGFAFTDRFGFLAIPTASPIPLPQPDPSSGSVPVPSTGPIPMPAPGSGDAVVIAAGTVGRFPFLLRFGCGVVPDGTIRITVGTLINGRPATTMAAVRVSE